MKTKSFTRFPRLPLELRFQIWKHASFHARNVDITASYAPSNLSTAWDLRSLGNIFYYISACPPPSLLSVNRESRSVALKHYTLDFGVQPILSDPENAVPPRIYMNWAVDRIVVLNWGLFRGPRHVINDFREKCTRNGLRFLACNLQGGIVERHLSGILPGGVELEEISFFNCTAGFYEKPMRRKVKLEERRMNQVGAFKEMVDAVIRERRRREDEIASSENRHLKEGGEGGDGSVGPLVVKLVRLVQ
jgi:hypothetical protein